MSKFDDFIGRLLDHEGGYSTNRLDPGNWTGGRPGAGVLKGTKYGIAANSYPNVDIKNLTWDQAKAIYRRDFWDKCRCDDMPPVVAFQLLDGAVNSGPSRAVRWLQFAARVAEDGAVGPKTLAAIAAADKNDLAFRFLGRRLEFMSDLPAWDEFSEGWAKRIADNLMFAAEDN